MGRDVKRIVTATMKEENERLMKEINGEEIKEQVEEIKEENKKVMNKLSEKEIEKQVNEYISTARNEHIEKEKRKNFLVLYGVKESDNETPEVRKEHDGNKWQKIFEELGVEGCTVDEVIRLGRRGDDGRDRPMMVKMSSERDKWTILSRAKKADELQ